jgi:hypothetical protein
LPAHFNRLTDLAIYKDSISCREGVYQRGVACRLVGFHVVQEKIAMGRVAITLAPKQLSLQLLLRKRNRKWCGKKTDG